MIEQRAELLFQRGKLKSDLCQSVGREAAAVAFAIDLQPEDTLCLRNEGLIPGFVKGASIESWFRESSATREPALRKEVLIQPADFKHLNIFAASNTSEQLGTLRQLALAAKTAKKGNIAVAFSSRAADSRTRWDAAMSSAGEKDLPVVFVAHGPWRALEPKTPEAMLNGIPAIVVDASDAVAIYRVASEAIARARQGRGPTFVECIALPAADAHPPADGRIHLQDSDLPSSDPCLVMKDHLERKGLWSEENHRQWLIDVERELDLATGFLNH
jgi:TPP-dependent pyruvate/acetoin dehydrogenase alpha subunit